MTRALLLALLALLDLALGLLGEDAVRLVIGLQLLKAAARLRMDGAGLALARAVQPIDGIGRLQRRRHRLDHRFGRHVPLQEREGAVGRDGDDLAILFALGHRGQALAHGDFGILPHVREQVLLDGEVRDLLEVERPARAAQDLDGRLGECHVEPRSAHRRASRDLPRPAPRPDEPD